MITLAFDENFNNDILRGILRRKPGLNIVLIQDAGLSGQSDPAILAWAAREGYVIVSHDVSTLTAHAYARINAGQPMPGLIEARADVSIAAAIEDLILIAECSKPGEWQGQVLYLPLR